MKVEVEVKSHFEKRQKRDTIFRRRRLVYLFLQSLRKKGRRVRPDKIGEETHQPAPSSDRMKLTNRKATGAS